MSKVEQNKTLVERWFTEFWGTKVNLSVVDELAVPDMLLQYSLHEARHGREDIKAFMTEFGAAFPDLNFWGTADLIAEGEYVENGGRLRHRPPVFSKFSGECRAELSAVTPSSNPISSAIFPFLMRKTVTPVKHIFRPLLAHKGIPRILF
ncbi:MAG TPA: ester cyclase [Candidatus Angelobacter sp.]|jgi:hypothetical protein